MRSRVASRALDSSVEAQKPDPRNAMPSSRSLGRWREIPRRAARQRSRNMIRTNFLRALSHV